MITGIANCLRKKLWGNLENTKWFESKLYHWERHIFSIKMTPVGNNYVSTFEAMGIFHFNIITHAVPIASIIWIYCLSWASALNALFCLRFTLHHAYYNAQQSGLLSICDESLCVLLYHHDSFYNKMLSPISSPWLKWFDGCRHGRWYTDGVTASIATPKGSQRPWMGMGGCVRSVILHEDVFLHTYNWYYAIVMSCCISYIDSCFTMEFYPHWNLQKLWCLVHRMVGVLRGEPFQDYDRW